LPGKKINRNGRSRFDFVPQPSATGDNVGRHVKQQQPEAFYPRRGKPFGQRSMRRMQLSKLQGIRAFKNKASFV
jgi:hypothetical protein